jgi:four helix bundle protein
MNNFRKLNIWKNSVELATEVYEITIQFPKSELYGLTSQIRRSVISVSSNIAEGAGRQSQKEFIQFLNIAKGSCYELETQLLISKNLKYTSEESYLALESELIKIEKMIYALIKKVKNKL